ncbi:MAG TPA: TIGR03560 family F420-dependent LLM class oxidoreductase [Candidatus Binataceae bacterium]|nr:TIGR03560 family F420-dependent LLM class oxidoreductase [Candidatus Binataceae bacterium]
MEQKIGFGVFSPQAGLPFKALLERALQIERLGYHSIWLVDHFWNRGVPEADVLECTTTMSALCARTEKLRVGSLVLCNSFRNPAMLAKVLASIDCISGGRLEIGLGAGWMDEEYRAYGYEFPSMGARLRQLEEGVQILKAMLSTKQSSFKGRYYQTADAWNNPQPVQRPHPPITIGGSGEKVMLKIIAKYADRWNCPAGYRSFEQKFNVLKEHCAAVGRDIKEINISEQLLVCIGANEAEVEERWKIAQRLPFWRTAIKGTPDTVVEQLRERVKRGIQFFTIIFGDLNSPQSIELFAREVMPAFA